MWWLLLSSILLGQCAFILFQLGRKLVVYVKSIRFTHSVYLSIQMTTPIDAHEDLHLQQEGKKN